MLTLNYIWDPKYTSKVRGKHAKLNRVKSGISLQA
jgi:hypothetical protein